MIRVDKHIHQEGDTMVFNQRIFSVGAPEQTPTGKYSKVARIGKDIDDLSKDMKFIVEFDNGETFEVYPVPPYDIAYEKEETKTEEQ